MDLYFDDLYTKLKTEPVSLDSLVPPGADAAVLQGIREIALRRNQSVCRECLEGEESSQIELIEKHIECLERYLSLLSQYLHKIASLQSVEGNQQGTWPTVLSSSHSFRWVSGLANSFSGISLTSVYLEEAMALCMYAAALQIKAWKVLHQHADETTDLSDSNSTHHVESVALLRKSAGVYYRVRESLSPSSMIKNWKTRFLPLELDLSALQALETLSLAQAQGVAADRAEKKGASPTATAAVHRGAVELYDSASALFKQAGQLSCSERLRLWLGLSSELHAIKALKSQAILYRDKGELGVACACLRDALTRIGRALVVVETADESWLQILTSEKKSLQSIYSRYDKERIMVCMQAIADKPPPPLLGKVVCSLSEQDKATCLPSPAQDSSFL